MNQRPPDPQSGALPGCATPRSSGLFSQKRSAPSTHEPGAERLEPGPDTAKRLGVRDFPDTAEEATRALPENTDVGSPERLYYRIGEVEELTEVPAYVLRYWESEFKLLRPKKNPAGQRLYRKKDLELVLRIKRLLYDERLTLEGAKKRLRNESRASQMDLGLRGAALEEALRRLRERLRALRERLAAGRSRREP